MNMNWELTLEEYHSIRKERDFCSQQLNHLINSADRFYESVYNKRHSPKEVVEFGKHLKQISDDYQAYNRMQIKKWEEIEAKGKSK